jgi:hypothetical protein
VGSDYQGTFVAVSFPRRAFLPGVKKQLSLLNHGRMHQRGVFSSSFFSLSQIVRSSLRFIGLTSFTCNENVQSKESSW